MTQESSSNAGKAILRNTDGVDRGLRVVVQKRGDLVGLTRLDVWMCEASSVWRASGSR
jgi:hypothetical protein